MCRMHSGYNVVAELVVIPSDVLTLYYKDNGTIALAKELRSH